jgi:propionyl-CoA synthetase
LTGAFARRRRLLFGRTDDVINVAGHRLGTRDRESISGHSAVAEVAVVGVADALKGQVAMAFVVKDASVMGDDATCCSSKSAIMKRVDGDLGAVAPASARSFVTTLPKTRSGKLPHAIQAVCEEP